MNVVGTDVSDITRDFVSLDEGPWVLWTEHEHLNGVGPALVDEPPASSTLHPMRLGYPLIGCLVDPTAWVLRGVFRTHEEGRKAHDLIHELGWDAYLAQWKELHGR